MTVQTKLEEFDNNTAIIYLTPEYDNPEKRDHIRAICKRYGCDVIFKGAES